MRGARAGDIGELALFLEKDIVDTIKDIQEKLNFSEFAVTSYMCGEIWIIQSKDFLSSSAVSRFSFHIDLRYQHGNVI